MSTTKNNNLTDTSHAKILFRKILNKKKWASKGMFDKNNEMNGAFLPISSLDDSFAWLPVWMLKSDELFVSVFNKRLWDVYYQINENSLENIIVIDKDHIEQPVPEHVLETYEQFPVFQDNDVESIRYKICELALRQILIPKGKFIDIRSIFIDYKIKSINLGDYIPFPSMPAIMGQQFQRLIMQSNKEMNIGMNPNSEPSSSPSV